jgi:UDPglucose 6-dehydrogenase
MKVCIFGLTHLGIVLSACLAKKGHDVTAVGVYCKPPIEEPGLKELVSELKTLSFTTDLKGAVRDADVVWVTYDTPVDNKDNPHPEEIEKRLQELIDVIPPGGKIIISSQVPVGFTRDITKRYRKQIYIAYSPENLRRGNGIKSFFEDPRIIVGTDNKEMFEPFFSTLGKETIWMSVESAEMTKHAINSFLAMEICFINEIAQICERVGATATDVSVGLKSEPRVGPLAYLYPGSSFMGGTLGRDIRYLQTVAADNRIPLHLIKAILPSNEYKKKQEA